MPGAIGGLLALIAVNFWFQTFSVLLPPGQIERPLVPDFGLYALVDVGVGAASGGTGYYLGQETARLLGFRGALADAASQAGALMMGTALALVVNLLLLVFSLM